MQDGPLFACTSGHGIFSVDTLPLLAGLQSDQDQHLQHQAIDYQYLKIAAVVRACTCKFQLFEQGSYAST